LCEQINVMVLIGIDDDDDDDDDDGLILIQEALHIHMTDEKRRRFLELVRQQKTVCLLLVSVSISCCAWFVSVFTA